MNQCITTLITIAIIAIYISISYLVYGSWQMVSIWYVVWGISSAIVWIGIIILQDAFNIPNRATTERRCTQLGYWVMAVLLAIPIVNLVVIARMIVYPIIKRVINSPTETI